MHDGLNTDDSIDFAELEDSLGDMPSMDPNKTGIGYVDRYELLEKLGEGGFGAVYGAKDTEAGILVALKALPSEVSCDADEMRSIRKNFALVSKLKHPNIAALNHLHKVEAVDGRAQEKLGVQRGDYLVVMEYAPGATLFAVRDALEEKKLPLDQVLRLSRQVAEALDYAHSERVLHRDIKAKNVMVQLDGEQRVKVLDFGLAAEIRSSMSRKSKDPQNSKSGTPLYMAPEQWRGHQQGATTDQYALAALVYELLSGAVPFKSAFDSGNFEIMRGTVCNEPVLPIPELTKKQNAVLLRALSKNPEERFGSCGEFVEALAGGRSLKPRRNAKSAKKWVVGICLTAVVVIGFLSIKSFMSFSSQKKQQATLAEETRLEAASAMREAQTALAAGDLDTATEKAQAVLKLDADNPAAAELLLEVEKKAGERRTREVKIDAELAVEKLERDITDRGQGFEDRFSNLRKELLIAQDAYEQHSWGQAFTAFKKVMSDGDALRTLDADREHAKKQRTGMESSRRGAEGAESAQLAGDEWNKGVASALRAEQQFEKSNFEEASKGWKTAAELFQGSEKLAVAVSDYRKAKESWISVTKEHKETQEEIQQYASAEWEAAEREARLGAECAGEPLRGKQHYEMAIAKVAEAVKKAEPYLVPRLTLACSPNGVESALRAENGESAHRADAATWELEKGKTYTLSVSKKGYKTHTEELTADWTGLKTKSVTLEEWSGPEDGQKWVAELGSGVEMDFMPINAGSFSMGSNDGDSDEKPVHTVRLTKPFWMGKTEVTQRQYQQIMGSNPSSFQGSENPVEQVSWNDAVAFCKKLTARERQAGRLPEDFEYTLPTEAQWEYACRAGSNEKYSFGDNEDQLYLYGNYCDRSNTSGCSWQDKAHDDGYDKTAPVGRLKPNAFGLYDMHGNVWEWCLDVYDSGFYGKSTGADPVNTGSGPRRVVRGGSWNSNASDCRSAYRGRLAPADAGNNLGFRVCLSAK